MTVYTEHRKIQHLGNNSLQTFAFDFEIPEAEYAFVYVTAASGGSDTEYTDVTWSGIGDENGGLVIFNTYTPTSTEVVTIIRDVDLIQETDYIEGGLFRAETHEDTFDYSRFVDQQLKETLDRCIKGSIFDTSSATCMVLESPEERANKYLWFNADGCVESREGTVFLPDHTHDGSLGEGGFIEHHVLNGLLDDDHTQYYNQARGDARYSLLTHNHDGVYAFNPHGNESHSSTFITSSDVTFENLDANGDVGDRDGGDGSQVAIANHTHEFYSIPENDHDSEGFETSLQVGENVIFGNLLYTKSDTKLYLTDHNDYTETPGMAIALESKSTNEWCRILLVGFIRDDSWSWTPGEKIYMNGGQLSGTLYSGSGQIVQVCGIALRTNVVWFNPNFMVIQRA